MVLMKNRVCELDLIEKRGSGLSLIFFRNEKEEVWVGSGKLL